MDPTTLIDTLIDCGVLHETHASEIKISSHFATAVNSYEDSIQEGSGDDTVNFLSNRFDHVPTARLADAVNHDPLFVARLRKIVELSPEFSFKQAIISSVIIDNISIDPPLDGVPDSFLPLYGHRIPAVVPLFDHAIIYIWLEDCPPCETMYNEFNDLFPEPPADLSLFAVYGPNSKRLLATEFDITAGPVTLFVSGGNIDCRLWGAHYQDTIESEIGNIKQE